MRLPSQSAEISNVALKQLVFATAGWTLPRSPRPLNFTGVFVSIGGLFVCSFLSRACQMSFEGPPRVSNGKDLNHVNAMGMQYGQLEGIENMRCLPLGSSASDETKTLPKQTIRAEGCERARKAAFTGDRQEIERR